MKFSPPGRREFEIPDDWWSASGIADFIRSGDAYADRVWSKN